MEEAERRGAAKGELDGLRAEALQELGRSDEALEIRRRLAAKRGDLFALGAEAVVLAARGDVEAAEKLFIEAQYAYRDVSPFPFAWLYFCQGWMWERAGRAQRARELYQAALERLPGYAPATAHLAALEAADGRREDAIVLLTPARGIVRRPAILGQLSMLLRERGQVAEADRLRAAVAACLRRPRREASCRVRREGRELLARSGRRSGEGSAPRRELNLSARQTPETRSSSPTRAPRSSRDER